MKGICSLCHEEYDLTGYDFEEVDPKDYVCGGCDCDANRWQYKPWNFTLKLYFDGGCRPNPGKMVICSVLDRGLDFVENRMHIGFGTNNIAEYRALIYGLEDALARGYKRIDVKGDSLLVISQMQGKWKVKDEDLIPLYIKAKDLCKQAIVFFEWIPRDKNFAGKVLESYE